MPELLLYINSLAWRFVHFSADPASGPDERFHGDGEARDGRDDRPHRREKHADGAG
jgi:hypothetical protein